PPLLGLEACDEPRLPGQKLAQLVLPFCESEQVHEALSEERYCWDLAESERYAPGSRAGPQIRFSLIRRQIRTISIRYFRPDLPWTMPEWASSLSSSKKSRSCVTNTARSPVEYRSCFWSEACESPAPGVVVTSNPWLRSSSASSSPTHSSR